VILISPSATSPELTGADIVETATDERPGLLWRTAPPDTLQGAAIARHLETITDPAVTNVTVIHERGAYGDGLEKVFRGAFEGPGRTVRSIGYDAGNSGQRTTAIRDGSAGAPQFVLFFSSQAVDMSAFVVAVSTLPAYDEIRLFLTDTAANQDLLKNAAIAGAVFPRIIGSRPAVPQGPVYELFRTSYVSTFNQDPNAFTFVPHAYDAAWLAFYGSSHALRVEKNVTGSGIARGMRRIAKTGEAIEVAPANWTRIADAIAANQLVNVTGASGTLDFDLATEETTGAIDIWKISADGQSIEQVTTINP
jgi:branched-chain amino acid transport system substrate-binding protein